MTRRVAVVTLDGFNEIDSFVVARMVDSIPGLAVELVGSGASAVSMAGIEVKTTGSLETLDRFDAVVVGSGSLTFEHIENAKLMSRIVLSPGDGQLVGSQCSGAAILHRLGHVSDAGVCTDALTAPKLLALGVKVRSDSFHSAGHVATAGGCLSSVYLAMWMIEQLLGRSEAEQALLRVAPVGQEDEYLRLAGVAHREA